MFLGPVHSVFPGLTTGWCPPKPIRVQSSTGKQVVLYDNTYPYGLQSDSPLTSTEMVLMESTQAAILARIHQLEELAQNQAWSGQPGLYIQWREDGVTDGEDGFYVFAKFDASEDLIFSGYAEPHIDVELRQRYNPQFGVYVDAKLVPNDAGLGGVTLAAYPQGMGAAVFPAGTYVLLASDGSSITVTENPPVTMRGTLVSGTNLMALGRCSVFDESFNQSVSTEVFWKDHRNQNTHLRIQNGLLRYTLVASISPNLLTANQASLETDTTGWTAQGASTIARSTAQALHGVASLLVTSTGATSMQTTTGNTSLAVTPGLTYTAIASARPVTTARTYNTVLQWFDSGGTFISQVVSTGATESAGAWIQQTATGVAPANAAFASVTPLWSSVINGEGHYIDQISLALGTSTTWMAGGGAHPLVEVWSGSAWVTEGNYTLQTYNGAAYSPLPVQTFKLGVISPEEVTWDEMRFDAAGTGLVRVSNRIRRGSRLIESQIVSASGQGLTGPQSVGLTNVPSVVAPTPNLVANPDFETVGSTATLHNDPLANSNALSSSAAISLASNLVSLSASQSVAFGHQDWQDGTLLVRMKTETAAGTGPSALWHQSGTSRTSVQNYVWAIIGGNTLLIYKVINGVATQMNSTAVTIAANTFYWMQLSSTGTTYTATVFADTGPGTKGSSLATISAVIADPILQSGFAGFGDGGGGTGCQAGGAFSNVVTVTAPVPASWTFSNTGSDVASGCWSSTRQSGLRSVSIYAPTTAAYALWASAAFTTAAGALAVDGYVQGPTAAALVGGMNIVVAPDNRNSTYAQGSGFALVRNAMTLTSGGSTVLNLRTGNATALAGTYYWDNLLVSISDNTGFATSADGTGTVATAPATAVPGFAYLSAPAVAATATAGTIYSGLSVPSGTVGRISILAGVKDAQYTSIGTAALYAAKYAAYNRQRILQRILVS